MSVKIELNKKNGTTVANYNLSIDYAKKKKEYCILLRHNKLK